MAQGHDTVHMADTASADAVTDSLLAASRLLLGLSIRSIASVDDSITIPQFRLLVVLGTRGPMKLAALADALDVNPSTATRMIDRLTTAGLVDRQVNPASRREVVIDLTGAGGSTVARVMRQRRREIARVVARMPGRHRTGLVEGLESFSESGGEPPIDVARTAEWI